MASPRIVRFHRSHLPRILHIEHRSFGREAFSRDTFLDFAADCGDLFVVAKESDCLAGYILSCAHADWAEIVSIAVDPLCRGRGIGKALMRHALGAVRKRGIPMVELMVRSTDAATVRFYRSFGFSMVSKVRRYYLDGGDAWTMRKSIATMKKEER